MEKDGLGCARLQTGKDWSFRSLVTNGSDETDEKGVRFFKKFVRSTSRSSLFTTTKSVQKEPRFLPTFHSVSMNFHLISNWRTGSGFTHDSASFLYTLFFGTRSSQLLNCP